MADSSRGDDAPPEVVVPGSIANADATSARIASTAALSFGDRILIDTGRELVRDSLSAGGEFCRFMILITSGAIPVYVGLLGYLTSNRPGLSDAKQIVALVPALTFVLASVVFAFGFLPTLNSVTIDSPSDVARVRDSMIRRQLRLARWGFAIYCVGAVFAVILSLVLGTS